MNWIYYAKDINLFDKFDKDIKPMSKSEKYRAVRILIDYFSKNDIVSINEVPNTYEERLKLLYKILNNYNLFEVNKDILKLLDRFLISENSNIINISQLEEIDSNIYIYKGNITNIKSDAIVNVSNCRLSNNKVSCIYKDKSVYSSAGLRPRIDYNKIIDMQNYNEYIGSAKITRGYCLPSKYVIHTIAPIITNNNISKEKVKQLSSCYTSCLSIINDIDDIKSIVFSTISTGALGFPIESAANIAVSTVKQWISNNNKNIKVIFNVSSDTEEEIYKNTLLNHSIVDYSTI